MPIFSGLRARLQLFLLLAMLPSLALVLYTTFHSWKLTEAYTRDETTRLVRFAASDYQRLVEGTRHLLGALASVSEVRERRGASCSALFAHFKTGYPHYANLGAIGPDGYTFCSAVPLTERTKAGDRSYFRRAVETRDFAIGDYQIGRITGMPVVVFAYPSFNNAGRLRAVVFAALDLTWLNQLAVRARLPADSTLTLLDDKGTIINRYPEPEKWIGKKYPETQLVQTVLANPGGGTTELTGLDGKERLYTYAPLFDTPRGGRVHITIGVPRDVALSELRQVLARTLGGFALATFFTLVIAGYSGRIFLMRPVKTLIGAAHRLGRGDLRVRTGLARMGGEIGELARTFDEMAESLQAREARAQQAESAVEHLAYHDALTGLPNRLLLLDRLKQAAIEAGRHGRHVAMICLDMDRFKDVNDSLGHGTGDKLLKTVAERLTQCVRPGDTLARLGDDQFGIVLTDIAKPDDIGFVQQKLKQCFTQAFRTDGHDLIVTVSAGISIFPIDGEDPDRLMRNAEAAMYQAAEQGGNNYRFYSSEMSVKTAERLRIETGLHQALEGEKGEFLLHYQPQVSLKTGVATGVEALLRWRHPDLGLVSPATFIPIAEETGQIVPIGEWALRAACVQAKAWHGQGLSLRVSVNLSARQFLDASLVETVKRILAETGVDPRLLGLELTESALIQHDETVSNALHDLKTTGLSIAIDDFGTGYSSLGYLKRLPIDYLKIDQSFVRDIATDKDDATIVVTVIAMAHGLGMKVIAEGVETDEQLQFLREHGCDEVQGFLLARPGSAGEISGFLKEKRHPRFLKIASSPKHRARKTR